MIRLAADPAAELRAALRGEREDIERRQWADQQRLVEIRGELASLPSEEGDLW